MNLHLFLVTMVFSVGTKDGLYWHREVRLQNGWHPTESPNGSDNGFHPRAWDQCQTDK
jgi:hypothetical protein